MKAIETINLGKKFGKLTAVDKVNLKVDQGKYLDYWVLMVLEKVHSSPCYALF